MKKLFAVSMLLAFQLASAPAQGKEVADDVAKMIQDASRVLLDPAATGNQIQGALAGLLDAALLCLPRSDRSSEARSNLTAARNEVKDRSMFSASGMQHLSVAYRSLNAGKSFQFPEVRSIEEARIHIKNLIAASLVSINKKERETACRLLVESVIMVVTPMQK